ncbi:glycine cleavage system protein GcvH [uncultured Dialister sp.]|uniref:glycine cleavage system protein GcvH n=1 Tax=uncultured Dialister sp. TaxID=278064 RepID=UPI002628C9AD|nr:glycine cleavage system protein GcvH [uncultured Dialister sp.]
MNFPKDVKYAKTHEWVKKEGDLVLIGLTDYAQDQLGDIVFVNLPEAGDAVTSGDTFADIESVKAVSDVYSPVTGEVEEVNEELLDAPEKVNGDPYGSWFVKVKDVSDMEELMDAKEYEEFCKTCGEE